jgi:hypothetical protein
VVISIENTPIESYWSDLISTGNWSGLGGTTFGFNTSENDFASLVAWITGLPV